MSIAVRASDVITARRMYPRLPYHNFMHALDVMAGARDLCGEATADVDLDLVDQAALWHDVVYVVGSKANEADSASFAWHHLADEETSFAARVADVIMVTKDHHPDFDDLEACAVSDADMAGFAFHWLDFEANNARIDQEFAIGGINPEVYAKGRRAFFEGVLSDARLGHLFRFPVRRDERNARAAENLERALAAMG